MNPPRITARIRRPARSTRLNLQPLEDRATPAALSVSNTDIDGEDVNVLGPTSIGLGAGNDVLKVDLLKFDSLGNLTETSTFGDTFTVGAGAGNDLVRLSDTQFSYAKNVGSA